MNNQPRRPKEDPQELITSIMAAGDPSKFLDAHERNGQSYILQGNVLPVTAAYSTLDSEAVLKEAGVKFGEVVKDNPHFRHIELPPGWKMEAGEHTMWTHLVDESGRRRASIFYKDEVLIQEAYYAAEPA